MSVWYCPLFKKKIQLNEALNINDVSIFFLISLFPCPEGLDFNVYSIDLFYTQFPFWKYPFRLTCFSYCHYTDPTLIHASTLLYTHINIHPYLHRLYQLAVVAQR